MDVVLRRRRRGLPVQAVLKEENHASNLIALCPADVFIERTIHQDCGPEPGRDERTAGQRRNSAAGETRDGLRRGFDQGDCRRGRLCRRASQRRRLEGRKETALGAVVQRGRGESVVSFRQHHHAGQRHRAHQQPHRGRTGVGRPRPRDASDVDAATASLHGEPDPGEVAGGPSGHPGPERQDRGSDRRRRRGLQYRDARLGVRHERDWRGSRRTIRSHPSSRSM